MSRPRPLPPTDCGSFALPAVEAIDALPVDVLPALVLGLAALQARAAARLAAPRPVEPPDRLLTVKEAASLLGLSEDTLYRKAASYSFTRRPTRRAVRFSEQGIRRYLAQDGLDKKGSVI